MNVTDIKKHLTTAITTPYDATPQRAKGLLDMIKIRTWQKCKRCGGKFVDTGRDLICPICETRPVKFYLEWWYKGERFWLSTFNSYIDAQKKAVTIEAGIQNHTFRAENYRGASTKIAKRYQFSQVYEEWLKERKLDLDKNEIAPSYYVKLGQYKKKYVGFFGDADIREVKTYDIKRFKASLPVELKLKTQKNILDVLQKFFRDLYEAEFIAEMPKFPAIKNLPEPKWKWIEETDQIKILNHIPTVDRPIFEFLFATGLRPAEVRALKWENVVWDAEIPFIQICASFSKNEYRKITKTKNEWQIPITEHIAQILKKSTRRLGCDFVFWYQYKRNCIRPYGENKLGILWNRACEEAGIEDVTLYQGSRHSFGSQNYNAGQSLALIGAMMGHRSEQTTKRYAHLDKLKALKKAFDH